MAKLDGEAVLKLLSQQTGLEIPDVINVILRNYSVNLKISFL